jgi:hypothetical protein
MMSAHKKPTAVLLSGHNIPPGVLKKLPPSTFERETDLFFTVHL